MDMSSEHLGNLTVEVLGERVKRLQMARKLTQDRLSIHANVDQSGLSKLERGKALVWESVLGCECRVASGPFRPARTPPRCVDRIVALVDVDLAIDRVDEIDARTLTEQKESYRNICDFRLYA